MISAHFGPVPEKTPPGRPIPLGKRAKIRTFLGLALGLFRSSDRLADLTEADDLISDERI
mgnify:CR=1 FL=1